MEGADGAVILGMSRSGTSAVAAMFVHAGFYAGTGDELMPATDANPGGYWENSRLWRLNEKILKDAGRSWVDPPTAEAQQAQTGWACPAIKAEVERIFERADGAPVMIKDPRIGVLTTLWHPVIDGRLHPVLVLRDPTEIADSLYRRDGTPTQLGLAAWELHMRGLLGYLDGRAVTVAPYDLLLRDQAIATHVVECAARHTTPTRAARVHPDLAPVALERAFRHSEANQRDHREQPTAAQLRLWAFLSSLEHGSHVLSVPEGLQTSSGAARRGTACEAQRVRVAERAGELGAARAHIAQLEAALAAAGQTGLEREAALASARRRADQAERALTEEADRVADAERLLVAERERAIVLAAELDRATSDLTGAHAALDAITSSASWKLTRPLRFLKRHTRGASRRPGPAGPSCEIHVPISPTPSFITRVRYLAASVRRFGGGLASAPVIVTVGGDELVDLEREHPWSRALGVEWRWVPPPDWQKHSIAATALQRFRHEIKAPTALMLDADTLLVAPIDDQVSAVADAHAVCGVPAHVSPFREEPRGQALWRDIFNEAGLRDPAMTCEHSGWQAMEFDPARRFCPPYFNGGMVLLSRELTARIGETIFSEMEAVQRIHHTVYRCQLALTLATVRSEARWWALPLRFNFPNNTSFLRRHSAEFEDVRLIHYLLDDQLSRIDDFESPDRVSALLERDHMHVVNARLCEALREIHGHVLAAG